MKCHLEKKMFKILRDILSNNAEHKEFENSQIIKLSFQIYFTMK